ncbi:hypothetical protein LSH36_280g03017 [Paralvinella palmiformis]|uniref:Uncharacterized protein n=1 Tax=Paralvinella palmiformis TaxID=53620 RepID=A0AAD9JK65_9ANNE|nr:hypothetical protein LSH36_280g03017 [Paralvinella palmiformis]
MRSPGPPGKGWRTGHIRKTMYGVILNNCSSPPNGSCSGRSSTSGSNSIISGCYRGSCKVDAAAVTVTSHRLAVVNAGCGVIRQRSPSRSLANMEDVFRKRSCSLPELPPSILKTKSRTLKSRTTSQRDHVTVSKRASFRDNPRTVTSKSTSGAAGSTNPDIGASTNLIHCVESNIAPNEDAQGRTYRRLHIKLAIDGSCARDKTAVKALSGGKAVIVHLYLRDPDNDDREEHLESKLPLPLQVDPYSVKARVHKDGFLTISANIPNIPLKSTEQEDI